MKYLYTILAITFITILAIGCTYENNRTAAITVMGDETETLIATPRANELLAFYGNDIWNGREFRYQVITDVSINPIATFSLKEGDARLLSNAYVRKEEITAFDAKVIALMDSLSADTIGRERSSVYIPFAKELNRLAASNADTRTLIIYSDMRENTVDISFYRPNTLRELESDSEAMRKKFDAQVPLANLSGITVFIVYQPRDSEDDRNFRIVSNFYTAFLESKGASVTITATPTP